MKIANIDCDGRKCVGASRADAPFTDLTLALAMYELMTAGVSGTPANDIQTLLDTGRFDPLLFHRVLDFVDSHQHTKRLVLDGRMAFQAPFRRPGQIIALARNYAAHAEEGPLPPPREPTIFTKSNTSVIGPEETVLLPPNLGRIEPEIELAVVIRKKAWAVKAADAQDYIAGYTILNDVSAQELQGREIKENYPLFRCKSLPTFTPLGPWLVTVDELGVSPALRMNLQVNGRTRVTANTGNMTFGVPTLVEYITGFVALEPGDIITTGCPKAAGGIQPGDEVFLEIEKIGVLRNPIGASVQFCPKSAEPAAA